MHISSSCAKILGKTNFQPWEFPRSGSKAKDGKEKVRRERKKQRLKVGNNNGQLRIANATSGGARLGQLWFRDVQTSQTCPELNLSAAKLVPCKINLWHHLHYKYQFAQFAASKNKSNPWAAQSISNLYLLLIKM